MVNTYFKVNEAWVSYFIMLSEEEGGRLAKAIWAYQVSGLEPIFTGKLNEFWLLVQADMDGVITKRAAQSSRMRVAAKARWNKQDAESVSKAVKVQLSPEQLAIKLADEALNDEMAKRAAAGEDTYISNDDYYEITGHTMDERREMLKSL